MTIKQAILKGSRHARKKVYTLDELDGYACDFYNGGNSLYPAPHSVRARVSELTAAGELVRNTNGTYSLPSKENK